MIDFKTLKDLEQKFRTQEDCLAYYEAIRWAEGIFCPHCEGEKFYTLKKPHQYRCGNPECRKTFNVLHKTIFENSKLPLSVWFTAIFLATNHKKGISSHQLARDLGITQKTAWFVLHRIREMLKEKEPVMLEGTIEIDETYVGADGKNKHQSKKSGKQGFNPDKIPVIGLVQRGGKVLCTPIKDAKHVNLLPIMVATVKPRSIVYTDQAVGYRTLKNNYQHSFVNHKVKEYVRGGVHTNTIEGFWSLLKRGIIGIYHHTSPKHLNRYCTEFSFRYNTRKQEQAERFNTALRQSDQRILYKELIAK